MGAYVNDAASQDNVDGYLDGRDPASPEPSANRSWSYRHSFAVGRREIEGKVPIAAPAARALAQVAADKDASA